MLDKSEFMVGDVKYPLVFNLNVMEEIQNEYSSIQKWSELVEGEESDIKALKYGITAMINEGIDIENENLEIKREFVTTKQVGRIITQIGLKEITKKVQKTVVDSTQSESKNV